uniref:Apple domain-containing protein n=1 Tax=Caenorhabditis tropicalis TaxID=1561998 RepID=A0A1I7V194_9PELO
MRPVLLLLAISLCWADSGVLRPCFERYSNHRLVNLRPYHSEWRMRTEDMCLLFCAQSASRCRSVVYDTVQHICHYFSDEGVDQAVLSAKMTYLRVVSQSCLQENVEMASDPSISPPDAPPILLPTSAFPQDNGIQQELAIPEPPVEETTTPVEETTTPEVVTFETATLATTTPSDDDVLATTVPPQIDEADLDAELKAVMEPSQFTGSFSDSETQIDNNGVYRDKSSSERRWMDSMEKMDSKPSGKKSIDEKLEDLKEEDHEKYQKLMGAQEEVQELKNNLRYGAKVIKFDEEAAFRKQSELRRKPMASRRPALKPVTISSTSYIQKAKSFLDELNEDVEESTGNVVTTECQSDDVDVWIAFENSAQADELEDADQDSNVESRKECQRICKERNCRSFTYFEKTHMCHLSSKSDGVTLQAPESGDFSASTSTKFCYPRTFSVFDGCSNFVAFRDYSVRMEAVEEFDGLPRGYEGMQLCVELCVLSTRYTCRSATFNPITGKCRLLTEDSLSSPDSFKYDEFQKDLYFENGCTNADGTEATERNVEIVAIKPKKRRVKKMKKLRRRHRS